MTNIEFQNTEKLYHYTSFESALKILGTKSLRFSKLSGLNDINESYRPIIDSLSTEISLSFCGQISFTHDGKREGFAIPSLWGHYAQKGYGVCFVFDKSKIISQIQDAFEFADNIRYNDEYDNTINPKEESVQTFFAKNRDKLFFTKKADWCNEQEFRILGEAREYMSYEDSLMAIIMCFADDVKKGKSIFNSANAKILRKCSPYQVPILQFGYSFGNPQLKDENNIKWN